MDNHRRKKQPNALSYLNNDQDEGGGGGGNQGMIQGGTSLRVHTLNMVTLK